MITAINLSILKFYNIVDKLTADIKSGVKAKWIWIGFLGLAGLGV
jgi:hypothetical protein